MRDGIVNLDETPLNVAVIPYHVSLGFSWQRPMTADATPIEEPDLGHESGLIGGAVR